jgi:RNA polymerase sigma factor (sigma-70 family)
MDESEHAAKRREQFESNCERYRKELYYFTLSKVRNKADAEDISNETILCFFKSMESRGWPEIGNVMAYLIESAKNLCIKRARRPPEDSLDDLGDEEGEQIRNRLDKKAMQDNDPTSGYEHAIRSKKLLQRLHETILSDLTEEEWSLLYMRDVEGMKAKEIAEELGMHVDSVRYKLNMLGARIRYRLRYFEE